MRRFPPKTLTLICLIVWTAAGADASSERYVHDHLVVSIRSEPSTAGKHLKSISTGARLLALSDSSDARFTLVRDEDGTEGWVQSQYLVHEPVARQLLSEAETRLANVSAENTRLERNLNALKVQHGDLRRERDTLKSEFQKAQDQVRDLSDLAARPAQLRAENEQLKQAAVQTDAQLASLQKENVGLMDTSNRIWFFSGAGVLVFGVLMGLIIPRIRWKKRSSWADGF